MSNFDRFWIFGCLCFIVGVICLLGEANRDQHGEIFTSIDTSTQIEDELIKAVNSALEHIESQPLDFDCSAMVEFLEGVRRAKINRGPMEEGR